MSGSPWYLGSYDQIAAAVNAGAGPGAGDTALGLWRDLHQVMFDVDGMVNVALANAADGWTGEAADALRNALAPLSSWVTDASTDALITAGAMDAQAHGAGTLRQYVPESSFLDKVADVAVPVVGIARTEDAQRRAFDYAQQTAANQRQIDFWSMPPQVTVDVPPPGSRASTPVGGAGTPVAAPRAGASAVTTAGDLTAPVPGVAGGTAGAGPGTDGASAAGPAAGAGAGPAGAFRGTPGAGTAGALGGSAGDGGPGAFRGTPGAGSAGAFGGTSAAGAGAGPGLAGAPLLPGAGRSSSSLDRSGAGRGLAGADAPGTAGGAPGAGIDGRALGPNGRPVGPEGRALDAEGRAPAFGRIPALDGRVPGPDGRSAALGGVPAPGGRSSALDGRSSTLDGRNLRGVDDLPPGYGGRGSRGSVAVPAPGAEPAPRSWRDLVAAQPAATEPAAARAAAAESAGTGLYPPMTGAGAGGQGRERRRPTFLVDDSGAFVVATPYPGPVIGPEEPPGAAPAP